MKSHEEGAMEKEITCPWCNETSSPGVNHIKTDQGNVIERRCSRCNKILAAYPEQEGDFLPRIRKF